MAAELFYADRDTDRQTDRHHEDNRHFPRFLQTRLKPPKHWMHFDMINLDSPMLVKIQKKVNADSHIQYTINNTTTFWVRTFVSINIETACCDTVWSRRWTSNQILQTNRMPPITPVGIHPPICKLSTTQNTNTNTANEMSLKELLLSGPDYWEIGDQNATGRRGRHNDERTTPSTRTPNATKSTSVRLKSKRKSLHPLVSDDTV